MSAVISGVGASVDPAPFVCPDTHKHGQNGTCNKEHGCRCEDCRHWSREHAYYRNHMQKAGKPLIIDATGTHRRIQAMVAVGWSLPEIAERLGMNRTYPKVILAKPTITRRIALKVARLYDELAMTPRVPPPGWAPHVARTKSFARRKGWVSALAWDDETIDDPTAKPQRGADGGFLTRNDGAVIQQAIDGEKPNMSPQELREVVAFLHSKGWSDRRMSRWTGRSEKRIGQVRVLLGLPSLQENGGRTAA